MTSRRAWSIAACILAFLGLAPWSVAAQDTPGEPRHDLGALLATGVLVGSAANSFTERPHEGFHFTNEGFFGRDTYVGGADKVSHFVNYSILSKELSSLYGKLGYPEPQAILLGFGVSSVAGLVTEIGDGTTFYGFSYEDLVMDTLGAGTAALVTATRANDLIGFRGGFLLPPTGAKTCCQVRGKGRDYSNEIDTADLKLAGLARRLGLDLGPLRYLLLSVTYGSKGYPRGAPALRERQLGLEIGLSFEAILNDVGARRNTWWGYALHVVFDNVRVPFTAVGFRYDLNHDRWHGPDNGNSFTGR
jgi:predicted lipoprotein DUF2279